MLANLWSEQGRRAEACDLLAPLYGWFTQGFGIADLQEAKSLLDVRSHPSVVHGIGTRRDRPGRVAELLRRVGLVITGGPGVGKTTVVNSILKILIAKANVGGKPDTTLVVAE